MFRKKVPVWERMARVLVGLIAAGLGVWWQNTRTTMTTEQETDLIDLAVTGDRYALQEVIRLWGPRVRRFAGRHCPASEVLDAVQETLLILAERIGTLRAAQALTSWSFQVVKRQCVKAFSQLRRDTALARSLGGLNEEDGCERTFWRHPW